MTGSSSFRFQFSDKPVHRWGPALESAKLQGADTIATDLLWGTFERAPQIRDFSPSSSRGLERLVQLVADKGMKLEARIGFLAHTETFPRWIYGLQKRALIPKPFVSDRDDFAFTEVPSLCEQGFQQAFLGFLAETFSILQLYSDEVLTRIYLDFGIFESDVSFLVQGRVSKLLEIRYKDIKSFNQSYGTAFRDFSSLQADSAISLLLEKRPWLASFDYRWCRAQILVGLWEKVWALAQEMGLSHLLTSSLKKSEAQTSRVPWALYGDPIYIDQLGENYFPFFPEGVFNEAAVRAFRMWEQVRAKAKVECQLLPLWDESSHFSADLLVALSQRYLTRASFLSIYAHLKQGKHAYFPFGLPQFDESMECFEWKSRFEPNNLADDLARQRVGEGSLWYPREPLKIDDGLWTAMGNHVQPIVRSL